MEVNGLIHALFVFAPRKILLYLLDTKLVESLETVWTHLRWIKKFLPLPGIETRSSDS